MKIQQHDGVVVEATVISAGLRQAHGEGGVSPLGGCGERGCCWGTLHGKQKNSYAHEDLSW